MYKIPFKSKTFIFRAGENLFNSILYKNFIVSMCKGSRDTSVSECRSFWYGKT